MYAQIQNPDTVLAYPLTEMQVKEAFPTTSFAIPFTAPDGYVEVKEAPKPTAPGFIYTDGTPVLVDGGWTQAWNATAMTEPQASAQLAELKTAILGEVNRRCDTRINALTASYPATERLTFNKQEMEATAFLADSSAATPMLDALALMRGIDITVLAERIVAKAGMFAQACGATIGHRQKLEDQLTTAVTHEDLAAIDPTAGWPF